MNRPKPDNHENKLSATAYLQKVQALFLKEKQEEAYAVLQEGMKIYADDPFLLSYLGYFKACIDRRYRNGIEDCTRALSLFQKKMLRDEVDGAETAKSVLYLNLGKAFLAARKRKFAFEAFHKGLQSDRRNAEILSELQIMGIRKVPPLPFLDRSNLVNECLGRMLNKTRETT